MERAEFEMSPADMAELLEACKPVPAIMLQCGPVSSPQENANRAWQKLGEKMGFDGATARPVPGKDVRFFTALRRARSELEGR